jgi:GntR family transcriptional regulator/MocR family aminotransferase
LEQVHLGYFDWSTSMPRRANPLPLALPPRDRHTPAQRWLYDAVRTAILERRLTVGARLPSSRELALSSGLARGTVVAAFEQLQAEGYIESIRGSGTRVRRVLPDDLLQAPRSREVGTVSAPRRRLSRFARRARPFAPVRAEAPRAFRPNEPALDLFPAALWAQLAARRLRRATWSLLSGSPALGYLPLREAIAAYLTTSRGVRCTPDQVIVVSGTQEALDLSVRVLLEPGDRVCIESPGYVGASRVFEAAGLRMLPMLVDDEGARPPSARNARARLAYVTPAHQFPTGSTMSLARRLAFIDWARASNALIFEDDYDSEFRYAGRPAPSLQGLDPHGVVLFSGTFSKVLFPALRVGYLVVPLDLVDRFAAVRSLATRHNAVLDQAVLTDFIVDGHFGRHIRTMRGVYAERLTTLLGAAREHLEDWLDVTPIEAGLQIAAWAKRPLDCARLVTLAPASHLELVDLGRFSWDRSARDGLLLGFAAVDPAEIRRGAAALSRLLASFAGSARARPRSSSASKLIR